MTTHTPGVVYKLGPGTDDLGPLGLMIRAPSVHTNAGRMSATVTISTQDEDRSGDVVVTKGIRLDGHRKNPICLLNHNRQHAVGFTQDRLGTYTVKMHGDNRLVGEVFFNQGTQLGIDTFRAVEGQVLRGVSIGFLPVVGRVEKRNGRGTHYHAADLVEVSIVPIPDNENALIEAVHKAFGKKPPCPELAAELPSLDYRPTRVAGGWDADAIDKAGTYKMAEPKLVEAKHRSPTYYTCPHCGEEMSHEHIYHDEKDGVMRHGSCRGAVILKPPEPTSGLEPPAGASAMPYKSLAEVITSRIGALRRKAMTRTDPNAVDDFAPVDDLGTDQPNDSNAVADPHADHKSVVDEAVGNVLASIYDKFTSGQIDLKGALKLFKDCLTHHGNVSSLGGEEDPDEPLDLDDEPDPDDLDDDDVPDDEEDTGEGETDTGDMPPPKKKSKAKFYHEYTPTMETWITKSYRLCRTLHDKLTGADDVPLSRAKLVRVCEEQIEKAETLEPVVKAIDEGVLVRKAKPAPDAPPATGWTDAEFERAFSTNGDSCGPRR